MQLIILGIIVLVIWVYIDDKKTKKRNRRLVMKCSPFVRQCGIIEIYQ